MTASVFNSECSGACNCHSRTTASSGKTLRWADILLTASTMDMILENANASPPSLATTNHLFFDSVRGWQDKFFHIAVLQGKQVGIGLALMIGFGVGEAVLSITRWLGLIIFVGKVWVENETLSWAWSQMILLRC